MSKITSIVPMRTDADWQRIGEFAESFGHRMNDRSLPVHAFVREGQIRGYAQVHKATPLAFTAWHTDPTICTVRDVVFGMTYLKGWAKITLGGGLIAVPVGSKTFTPEAMEKLNCDRLGLELYQTGE